MKKYVLGIDQGTTKTKAMVFSEKAEVVGWAQQEIRELYPQPGWAEQDPQEIWKSVYESIVVALQNAHLHPGEVSAIGIANQRDTTLFWNRQTGNPIGRAIVWQDRRSLPVVERMARLDGAGIVRRSGMALIPNIAASKICWAMENMPEVTAEFESGNLVYGTVDSWLLWKLSGGKIHATDYSNASVTALLQAQLLKYDDDTLKLLNIPRDILPCIRDTAGIFGYTDVKLFGAAIPLASVVGDQQAAMLGQGCIQAGMAKNTYGTGSFILYNTGKTYVSPQQGVFSPILWKIGARTDYALEGMADVSGAAIQWLRDGLQILRDSHEAEMMAASLQDNGGIYFVPAFMGLGSPYFDSYARGFLGGIHAGTTRAHIARAALEGMAYQVRDALAVMETACGKKLQVLRVDGGGAQNDFLMQFQADILGIPVERPAITETTCLGAACLAGTAVGVWDSLEDACCHWRLERRFEPTMVAPKRKELLAGWKRAVEAAAHWLAE